jgi:predicted amidohydrolase YtcJ
LDPSSVPFRPEEALTREEALLAMTAWTAEAEFAEGDTGRLDPGCWMDATILTHDPLKASIDELEKTSVQGTIVRGEMVYSSVNAAARA